MKIWMSVFLVLGFVYATQGDCAGYFSFEDNYAALSMQQKEQFARIMQEPRPYFTAMLAQESEVMTFEMRDIPSDLVEAMKARNSIFSIELIIDTLNEQLLVVISDHLHDSAEYYINLIDQTV